MSTSREKWDAGHWILLCVVVSVSGTMLYLLGGTCYQAGYDEAKRVARDARKCDCDETKSCAFAPGIVGVRSCQRYDNRWGRCEPDGRYRIADEPWRPLTLPAGTP